VAGTFSVLYGVGAYAGGLAAAFLAFDAMTELASSKGVSKD